MASLVLLFQRYRHFTGIVLNLYKPEKDIGFPGSSAGKESACNVGDPSLIPGLGRSAGEGVGYPLQYSGLENSMDCIVPGDHKESDKSEWLSVSQGFPRWPLGKESACQCRREQETWVWFLGWKDPLEEEMATHSSILAWEILWTEEPGGL